MIDPFALNLRLICFDFLPGKLACVQESPDNIYPMKYSPNKLKYFRVLSVKHLTIHDTTNI